MIAKMLKVQIIGLKNDLHKLISTLHNLGVLHIEAQAISDVLKQYGLHYICLNPEEGKELKILEEIVKKANEILSQMKGGCLEDISKLYQDLEKISSFHIQTKINNIDSQLNSIREQKNRLQEETLILFQYKRVWESFLKADHDLSKYKNLECLALIFPKKYERQLNSFKERIEAKIKHRVDIYRSDFDQKRVVVITFYDARFSKDIDEEIFEKGTQKFILPQEFRGGTFQENLNLIHARQREIQSHLLNCNEQIDCASRETFCFLHAVKNLAKDRLDEFIVEQGLAESKVTVSITGWLPAESFNHVRDVLEKEFTNRILISDITNSVRRRQDIPVLLENPVAIKPFELMLSILEPPKYGSQDPTKFLAIFFPIFFGLIVGDAGYGLVLLLFSLILKRFKTPLAKNISKLVSFVSVSSIAFGILFAEFFGELGTKFMGMHPILFHRQKDIIPFLVLAVSIGAVHIFLGLILGIIEAVKLKHKKEVLQKSSIILTLFGLFFLVATFSRILPKGFLIPAIVLLVISLPLLILAKGLIGPLEAISTIGNILSYARIMALGVAGVMLAHIANTFGGLIENVILGIIVAGLVHILNLILSVFSPTIQSLRLHYVEFFSKFYEPGGKRYIPFKKREVEECIH